MRACTIVAQNYLPQARVLASSFLDHHDGGTIDVLVIDLVDANGSEPFGVLTPFDLGLTPREVHRMALMYDVKEFATALKPFLLAELLQRNESDVIYFDPDIWIFSGLDEVPALSREHSIVLTPHTTAPFPVDGRQPDDRMILQAGIYNLGFIAVGPGSKPFLEWWAEKLSRYSIVAVEEGLFVDQRWVDFVPALFDHYVLSDPTCNVAFWNLHERRLQRTSEGYEVNGSPLRFFHFSGFDPESPGLLSQHVSAAPRIKLDEHVDVALICREYAQLLSQFGFDAARSVRYRFDLLADGTPVDLRTRHLFRDAVLAFEAGRAAEPPDPFDPDTEDEFRRWVNRRTGVKRRLLKRGRPAKRPASWQLTAGHPARPSISARPSRGVNIVGYLEAELGLGEIGRKIVAAAEASNVPVATVTFRRTQSRQEHRFEQRGDANAPYDTNIICVNADGLHLVRDTFGSALAGRYSIGVWFWELGSFPPSQHQAFHLVDEVWVASPFVRAAIAAQTHKPVLVVPIPLEPPAIDVRTRAELGLPDSFVFLFSFDFFSVMERKNPLGLVEAFCRAFGSGEGPTLLIKTINGERKPEALNKLRNAVSARSDIRIVDGYVAPGEKDALMAACDCYVSLHRSEGLGLTMAEAMSLGKPVIATGYSGNLAFMDVDNSYLVRYTTGAVPAGCDPYPQGVEWAEPDLDHAAKLLRRVVEYPDEAAILGERGREAILKRHTVTRTAEFIRRRFDEIPHHPELLRYVRGPLEEAASISARPPGASIGKGKGISPTVLLRRLLSRALWPEFAEQRRLDAAVIDSLRGLEQVIRSESTRSAELERRIDSGERD